MFGRPAWTAVIALQLALAALPAAAQHPVGGYMPPLGDVYAAGPAAPPPLLTPGMFLAPPSGINERFWIRGEYLQWWTDELRTPSLVTTSPAGTLQNQAGILGMPGVAVLFGGEGINDGSVGGFRTRGGFWFDPVGSFGIEADYLQLFEQDDSFAGSSDGSTILAIPFFDITNDRETAQLIGFPGVASGNLNVGTSTEYQSFGVHGRASLCPPADPCQFMGGYRGWTVRDRIDWLIGYRYAALDDAVAVSQSITSLIPATPGTLDVRDDFRTENQFHGVEVGMLYEADWNRFWLESLMKIAVGNNRQKVDISGSSVITEAGIPADFTGGLLAQRSNIGHYSRDEFAVLPELGLTLGFHVGPRLSVTAGYSLVYLSNVVRAGDQIDTDLNPNLFPPEAVPFTGSLRPRFAFRESDFWAHGPSVGADLRF